MLMAGLGMTGIFLVGDSRCSARRTTEPAGRMSYQRPARRV